MTDPTITYTVTDEAPALASQSLLPIIRAFTRPCGIRITTRDISLAGRILANFPEHLTPEQQVADHLTALGELAKTAGANIVKLPNISASVPQLKAAVAELQSKGYNVPDYPEDPQTPEEKDVSARYARVLGSAVNPVLREGNSDRRVAPAVKAYARKNPHAMGEWSQDCRAHVAHMTQNDFYGTEQARTMDDACCVDIVFEGTDGAREVLRDGLELEKGEILDAAVMSAAALDAFYDREIRDAGEKGLLLSLHLKATMMKISDPYMFGRAVRVYFKEVFSAHGALFREIGVNPANGLGDLYARIKGLPEAVRQKVEEDILSVYEKNPKLAMVDSDRGITNLHVPSDVIVDASMPACLRNAGKMWGPDGNLHETKAMIPDRCYAMIYARVFEFCKKNGAFDPRTMGSVSNVGLMAKKAEEYGSHDKTFIMKAPGRVRVTTQDGGQVFDFGVEQGDIFRMCQTKDDPIRDWVKLGVGRARATGLPAYFWLSPDRGHDAQVIAKVEAYLALEDTAGLDIRVLPPEAAMDLTLERVRQGKDTISVTGNVLRDYLTDLFPILELGTSSKMLSIVPLLSGGGLFETGAGGSAPMLFQQFLKENHLAWDSLGEYLALAVSLEDLGVKQNHKGAGILSRALNEANTRYLMDNRSPGEKVGELDTRASHFYLALYWAKALAEQTDDGELQALFAPVAQKFEAGQEAILSEFDTIQGQPFDIGGYYRPDPDLYARAMRPSARFNEIVESMGS